jgi:hypothetical protein
MHAARRANHLASWRDLRPALLSEELQLSYSIGRVPDGPPAARSAASAAASRCTSSATRRPLDSATRHLPEQHRAVGRTALKEAPHTTQASFDPLAC